MRRLLSLCAAVIVASTVAAAQNDKWGGNYFPNAPLTTHEGKTVRFYDDLIKGKVVAVNLIYTSCSFACPLETARLAQVQKLLGDRMGKDVFFYSISIDPEHDTPAVLKAYAEKFHAGPGWLFLTGKKADIDTIGRKLGIYSDPGSPDGHAPHLLIGNEATGQWMRNSGTDNARFLANTIGSWLNSWQTAAKPTQLYDEAPKLVVDGGEYAFKAHCAACHTVGKGDAIGPDLLGVTTRRDRRWLTRFITSPDKLLAEGDPIATKLFAKYQVRMPAFGLAESDAALVLEFLARRTAEQSVPVKRASMARLVDPYVQIQRALNADSVAGVDASARAIAAEAASLGNPAAAIANAAETLSRGGQNLAAARAAFAGLSDAVLRYAGRSGAALGADVKVAFCPMAGKYWLQRGAAIQNPFYGRAMSDCGRLVAGVPASLH